MGNFNNFLICTKWLGFLRYVSTGVYLSIVRTSSSGSAGPGSAAQLIKERESERKTKMADPSKRVEGSASSL